MQKNEPQFNVQELFYSLSNHDKERINSSISENTKSREDARYERIRAAEIVKNELIQERDRIDDEISKNDNWFIAAKEHQIDVTTEELIRHRRIAKELYTRKRMLIDEMLPDAESTIKAVVHQIQAEEAREPLSQRRDLERLLLPFYEARERARRQVIITETKERRTQWEEEEAKREEEYEAILNRLRADELERRRHRGEEWRKKQAMGVRARVNAKNIPYLVHFTPIANVDSILKYGLRSRNALAGHDYVFTDDYRSDGWLDWISLSVSFPNYKMLYKKRRSQKHIDGWAILLIKRELLWELDCKFILTNAARFEIRLFRNDKWSSAEAFDDMFKHTEHRHGIPDYFTTDPQAEVMVRNEVPKHFIDKIAVMCQDDLKRLCNSENIRVETNPDFFQARSDYKHWQNFYLSPFST